MTYMPEDREPAWYPTALVRNDDGSPWINELGKLLRFDPRLSEADYVDEIDGMVVYPASVSIGPRSTTPSLVSREQHAFIEQFEEARKRQSEAERKCAEARWAPPPPPPPPREPEPEEVPPAGKLTARQEDFCRHYAAQPVATRAAVLAGFAKENAAAYGSRLLNNPLVLERIAQHRAERGIEYVLERDTLHDKLEALFFAAFGERDYAAATSALRLQTALGGLLARKSDRVFDGEKAQKAKKSQGVRAKKPRKAKAKGRKKPRKAKKSQ